MADYFTKMIEAGIGQYPNSKRSEIERIATRAQMLTPIDSDYGWVWSDMGGRPSAWIYNRDGDVTHTVWVDHRKPGGRLIWINDRFPYEVLP